MAAATVDHVQVEKQFSQLAKALNRLRRGEGTVEELILIIRQPGYTTPAELLFTSALAALAEQQAKALATSIARLADAVKAVEAR
jgi:hypothetical protein